MAVIGIAEVTATRTCEESGDGAWVGSGDWVTVEGLTAWLITVSASWWDGIGGRRKRRESTMMLGGRKHIPSLSKASLRHAFLPSTHSASPFPLGCLPQLGHASPLP